MIQATFGQPGRAGLNIVNFSAPPGRDITASMCERFASPGLGQDNAEWVDYSHMPVCTPDQLRIEEVLGRMANLAGMRILHVGVGNSMLARRFAARCMHIDGLTISDAEAALAAGLGLANYRVVRYSKYGPDLVSALGQSYDVIVDNNLASFACCEFHLLQMFTSYRRLLRPGGTILTDQQGMQWSVGGPQWLLTVDDLERIGQKLGLHVAPLTPWVISMTRKGVTHPAG